MKITYVFFFLLLLPFVFSYGMASNYLENDTMILNAGETREYQIELQNNDKSQIDFNLELKSNITKIKNPQEKYTVGGDNPTKKITLVVEVPENARPGKEYVVRYRAIPLSASNNQISLNIEFNDDFKVKVRTPESPEEIDNNNIEYIVLGLTLLIFIASLVLVFRKNNLLTKRIFKK